MAKRKAKVNIPMCLAGVLFCLTLFSIHLTGGLYAKYTTSGTGSDSARVIKFGELTLEETGDFVLDKDDNPTDEMIVIPGVNINKQAYVSFGGSESATYVFLEIKTEGWNSTDNTSFSAFDNLMNWSVNTNNWEFLTNTNNETWVYYYKDENGILEPNTVLSDVKIFADINTDDGNIYVDKKITNDDLEGLPELSIKFQASVVQSGGFGSVTEAWGSLSAKGGIG